MVFRFNNGEIVQYNHPYYGQGKGTVIGYRKESNEWVVYPKVMLPRDDYPFMCIICKDEYLIATPF